MNTNTNTNHAAHCSCGSTEDHVVAKRRTADGKTVQFWSDGLVTGGMGFYVARVKLSPAARAQVMGMVELYDWAEVRDLVLKAHKAHKAVRS